MDLNIFEKDFYTKFSKTTEINTYIIVILLFVFVHLLPGITYNINLLYLFGGITVAFNLLWHHGVSERLSEQYINPIESFIHILLITVLIVLTGGSTSFFILLLLLPLVDSVGSRKTFHNLLLLFFVEAILFILLLSKFSTVILIQMAIQMFVFAIIDIRALVSRSLMLNASKLSSRHEARIEELTDLNKYKDEFVHLTTHELRTPITVIKGYLDLLSHEDQSVIPEKTRDIIRKLVEHTDNLSVIVDELLDVSKIETGRININYTKFNLVELIESVMGNLRVNAESKGVALKYSKNSSESIVITSDKDRLKEVLLNLMDNAVKYSIQGGEVLVSARVSGNNVEVSIKDNGIGIPVEDQIKIFQKFFRAKNVYKMAVQGTGLGLYIVYRLVDRLKGYIQFSSEENKGTVFRIMLPQQ